MKNQELELVVNYFRASNVQASINYDADSEGFKTRKTPKMIGCSL